MTEQHECEWRILLVTPNSATAQIKILCRICREPLLRQNAEAMLNEYETLKKATERLRAGIDELMDAAKDDPSEMGGPFVSLSWVANTLEGK